MKNSRRIYATVSSGVLRGVENRKEKKKEKEKENTMQFKIRNDCNCLRGMKQK